MLNTKMQHFEAFLHCRKRCFERYNKAIEFNDWHTMCDMIKYNIDCKRIKSEYQDCVYIVCYELYNKSEYFWVVWDIDTQVIKTFLRAPSLIKETLSGK